MYFVAYSQGRRIGDGYGPTVEVVLSQFPGEFELEGTLGDEQKWSGKSGAGSLNVVYIRPHRHGIELEPEEVFWERVNTCSGILRSYPAGADIARDALRVLGVEPAVIDEAWQQHAALVRRAHQAMLKKLGHTD